MFWLSESPQHHPDCCLSLSVPLLSTVRCFVKHVCQSLSVDEEVLLLSIGAGSGLFESYLKTDLASNGLNKIKVEAVEVRSAVVSYLPEDLVHRVTGSWDVSDQAHRAHILLFVYPREPHLVRRYMSEFSGSVRYVLWFGPQMDWVDYKDMSCYVPAFETPEVLERPGLATYELGAAFENKSYGDAKNSSAVEGLRSSRRENLDSI